MTETIEVEGPSGLRFTADLAGPADGPLVLLLHGFPESRHTWTEALARLADTGYRAVAPDQRGYSPGARPNPADLSNYDYQLLIRDVADLADAVGGDGRRFHLMGHDWGGQVAWGVAAAHPDQVVSLTVLSRPHPAAFLRALERPEGDQRYRSRHHRAFLDPETAGLLLADDARRLRSILADQGVAPSAVEAHLSVLGRPDALEAALAWYRANRGLATDIGPIRVPTLYVWGDADATVGADAARGTAELVTAPYTFAVLPDVGHFVMDQAPDQTIDRLLQHLGRHAA
ncbi:MAG: alpha/beta fold hydrolase [Acidimicrobiales bacterium]